MLWVLFGLLHSLFRSAFSETGRLFGQDGLQVAFWQSLAGLVFILPFLSLGHWPADSSFYAAAAGVALISSVGTLIHLTLATHKSGRVSSIYMPLEAIVAALLWLVVMPSMIAEYTHDILMTVSVLIAFLLCTVALAKIRPNDVSARTFMVVAPLGMTYAVAGVVTKTVLPFDDVLTLVPAWTATGFAVMTLVMGIAVIAKKKAGRSMLAAPVLKAGVLTGLFSVLGYATFVASVVYAPNPGYTSILAMLAPVWLLAAHHLARKEDGASPLAALFIVIGSLLLIVAAL